MGGGIGLLHSEHELEIARLRTFALTDVSEPGVKKNLKSKLLAPFCTHADPNNYNFGHVDPFSTVKV